MEARIILAARLGSLALLLALASCDRGARDAGQPANGADAVAVDTPRAVEAVAGVTPMAERVAVLELAGGRSAELGITAGAKVDWPR
jgi:hypothetical protein